MLSLSNVAKRCQSILEELQMNDSVKLYHNSADIRRNVTSDTFFTKMVNFSPANKTNHYLVIGMFGFQVNFLYEYGEELNSFIHISTCTIF